MTETYHLRVTLLNENNEEIDVWTYPQAEGEITFGLIPKGTYLLKMEIFKKVTNK